MGKRFGLNLSLLALVLILAAIAAWEPGLETPPEPAALTTLDPAGVDRLRIERAETGTLVFTRRDGHWWLEQPVPVPASDARLAGILRLLGSRPAASYPATEVDLAKLGLDEPAVRLVLNDDLSLAFGDAEPLNGRRYLLLGDTVHLVSDGAWYSLIGGLPTFVSRELLPPQSRITALELPGLSLRRNTEGRWQAEPRPEDWSADRANALLEHWRHTPALEVRGYAGEQGEPLRVILESGEQALEFLILARHPELELARPDLGLVWVLPDGADKLLTLPPVQAPAEPR